MVGHEILWFADQGDELAHPQVAAGERGEQPPAHGMGRQAQERRSQRAGARHTEIVSNELDLCRFTKGNKMRRWMVPGSAVTLEGESQRRTKIMSDTRA